MKKLFSFLALTAVLTLTSCGDSKTINGVTYQPYGWMDKDTYYADSVNYEVSTGTVVCSVIFCETIFVPILATGKSLYEPVSLKPKNQRYIHQK